VSSKAKRVLVPDQLYQVVGEPPKGLEAFAAAIFADRRTRGWTLPRQGGRVEYRCANAGCVVETVRVEARAAPCTWARTPNLYCPACGDPLRPLRRLVTVVLLPVPAELAGWQKGDGDAEVSRG
jgi:hypothetical protein